MALRVRIVQDGGSPVKFVTTGPCVPCVLVDGEPALHGRVVGPTSPGLRLAAPQESEAQQAVVLAVPEMAEAGREWFDVHRLRDRLARARERVGARFEEIYRCLKEAA